MQKFQNMKATPYEGNDFHTKSCACTGSQFTANSKRRKRCYPRTARIKTQTWLVQHVWLAFNFVTLPRIQGRNNQKNEMRKQSGIQK